MFGPQPGEHMLCMKLHVAPGLILDSPARAPNIFMRWVVLSVLCDNRAMLHLAMYAPAHYGVPAFSHMQVADAVGDEKRSTWIDMLASRVLDTDWEQSDPADHMLCSLLCLPAHLLHAVLTSYLSCMTAAVSFMEKNQFPQVTMLPPALLSECIAAMISIQGGSLELFVLDDYGLDTTLMHLRTASPPPPGLLSLSPNYDDESALTPATSALFARALAAHTTLQKLDLTDVRLGAEWLTNFGLCLATTTLPQLTRLEIGIQAADGGCAALARCLKHLPTLNELHVCLRLNAPPPSHSGRSALTAFARPASCPATLRHLQTLWFEEEGGCAKDDGSPASSCILQLLPLFTAPALSTAFLLSNAGGILNSGLVAALAMFPMLRSITIDDDHDDVPRNRDGGALMRSGPQLTSLQELCIINTTHAAALTLAAMIVSHTGASLTSLYLGPRGNDEVSSPWLLSDGWDDLLRSLAACNKLQWLQLEGLHGMSAAAGTGALLTSTFQHLTGLTGMELGGEWHLGDRSDTPLCGGQLGRALRCVTTLEKLSLNRSAEIDLQGEKAQAVLDACAELPCLRVLELLCHGFQIGQIATVLPKLRALMCLALRDIPAGDASVVAALRAQVRVVNFY